MHEKLKEVLDTVKSKFSADPQLLYAKLAVSNYLQRNEVDLVVNQVTTDMKTAILFLILRDKPDAIFLELQQIFFHYGWLEWLEVMQEKLHDCKREDLLWIAPETTLSNSDEENIKRTKIVQQNLRERYKEDCQFIRQFWTRYLKVVSMQKSYVDLEIEQLTVSAVSTGERINNYQDLFTNKQEGGCYKRILVEGDAGSGKSTYVNKIAFDWANGNPDLLAMFEYVFIFALQSLVVGIEESINTFVPDYLRSFVRGQLQSPSSKVLFIFDGFDEMDPTKDSYNSVVSILIKKMFRYSTCIVTSRRSHVDQLPPACMEQSLLLNGFNDESVATYMKNQGCLDGYTFLRNFDSENVRQLLRVPMFCAIYCSLWLGGALEEIVPDVYSLIDTMIDNYLLFITTSKNVDKKDVENQVRLISEFALARMDQKTKRIIDYANDGNDDDSSMVSRLNSVTLGLIIRRFVPTGMYKEFSQTFTFSHQLIAECLSARLLFKQTDYSKRFDTSKLYRIFASYHAFNLPFVQFLMTCLLKEIKSGRPKKLNILEPFMKCLKCLKTIEMFKTLNDCPNLTELDLQFCNLAVECIGCLTEGLNGNCFRKLQRLHLSWNENVGNSPKFFESLKNCQRLRLLALSKCNLSRQSVVALSGSINESLFRELEELNLYQNPEIGCYYPIFDSFSKCSKLRQLHVGNCDLKMETVNHFASLFEKNYFQTLQRLYLFSNREIGKTDSFVKSLEKMEHMEFVDISDCELSRDSVKLLYEYCDKFKFFLEK